jgi:hypothetical protein
MHATAFPNHLGIAKIACGQITRAAERDRANMTCLRDNASARIA